MQFLNMHKSQPLHPSADLTKTERLSKYNPSLERTPGDTDIYFFESSEPGGKTLILGGTHPNEPSGFLTTYLVLA